MKELTNFEMQVIIKEQRKMLEDLNNKVLSNDSAVWEFLGGLSK